jgi:kynurenine formamidase
MTEYRAHFDASVEFTNGGGLSAHGFRLDLPTRDADVAELFVKHLGLALVGAVTLTNLEIVEEAHKGSRNVETATATAPGTAKTVVDLSHEIFDGLVTYPGLPAPVITPHLTREASTKSYAPGTQFAMDIITMIGNTGTYLDSPFHRYEGGTDLAGLDLATLVDQPAEVFHLEDSTERGIPASVFFERDLRGKAVLLHTGFDAHFGTPAYGSNAPYLTEEGTRYLVEQGVTVVGIDSLNIDNTAPDAAGERPAHTQLLAANVHVVEHLTNLGSLPASGARFTAAPPKVAGFGTFPVRAFAIVG